MKYIVVEIQTMTDGTVAIQNFQKNSRNEAESTYHSILASAAISQLPVHAAVLMTNEGFIIMNQAYKHEVTPE